jgi:predicted GNAT family acetyltransferase
MYQCIEADQDRILEYIAKEPEINLFFFGDIENFGVEKEPVSIFAFPSADMPWDALLLQFFDFFIVYSTKDYFDAAAIAAFLKDKTVDCISGKTSLVKQLVPYFPGLSLQSTYISRLTHVDSDGTASLPQGAFLRRLGPEDIGDVVELLSGIEEFAASYKGPDKIEKGMKQMLINLEHGSLLYGVTVDGRLVATASTSAANSQSAMVVAVATREGYRQNGFATAAVEELCKASLKEGKRFLCLFYDNPKAGRIYRRIGFEECGEYAMLR